MGAIGMRWEAKSMLIHSPNDLAKMISSQRKRTKLSQADAGAKVGLKQTTLSHFEKNPENSQINTLFRILSALDLEIHINPKPKNKISNLWKEKW